MSDSDFSSTEKEKTSKSDIPSTEEIPPEVFDSSTYNPMTDLKTSATMNESETNKVLSDIDNKEPIESEAAHTESTRNANISSTNNTTTATTTAAPTMEWRASSLKKSKESQNESIWTNKPSKSIKK